MTPCFNKISDFNRRNNSQLKKTMCLDQYCTLQWLSTHRLTGSKDQLREWHITMFGTYIHAYNELWISKSTSAMFFGVFLCHVEIWRGQSSQDKYFMLKSMVVTVIENL